MSWLIRTIALCWMLGASASSALEFIVHPNADKMPAVTAVLAVGEVSEGDTAKLAAFLATLPPRETTAIYLASPGGSLFEGMNLGRFFKASRIKAVVEGNQMCASACALAFLGGHDNAGNPWRSSSTNSLLGFHAFSSEDGSLQDENQTQLVVSLVLEYGKEVSAPLEVLILNFATPSDDIYWLSETEICSLGIKLWDTDANRFVC